MWVCITRLDYEHQIVALKAREANTAVDVEQKGLIRELELCGLRTRDAARLLYCVDTLANVTELRLTSCALERVHLQYVTFDLPSDISYSTFLPRLTDLANAILTHSAVPRLRLLGLSHNYETWGEHDTLLPAFFSALLAQLDLLQIGDEALALSPFDLLHPPRRLDPYDPPESSTPLLLLLPPGFPSAQAVNEVKAREVEALERWCRGKGEVLRRCEGRGGRKVKRAGGE
ncbi:hypothetical protein JCM10213v2_003260 [Rhodosporidiobolus nylandii]